MFNLNIMASKPHNMVVVPKTGQSPNVAPTEIAIESFTGESPSLI